MKKVSKETIIRTVALVLALINQLLLLGGKSPLPIEDEFVKTLTSDVITVIVSVWAWWKNNSFTQAALKADEVLKAEKNKEV